MGVSLAPKMAFCPYWIRTLSLLLPECICLPLFFVDPLQVFVCLLSFRSIVIPNLYRVRYSFFIQAYLSCNKRNIVITSYSRGKTTNQMDLRSHECINEFFSAKHDCATDSQPA